MRTNILLALATLGFVSTDSAVFAQDSRSLFLCDYEPHASAIRDAYNDIIGRMEINQYTNEGRRFCLEVIDFKYNFRNFAMESNATLFADDGKTRNSGRDVAVQNARYGFDLRGDKAAGKEAMSGYTVSNTRMLPNMCRMCFPYANQLPAGRSYLDVVRSSATKVTAYREVGWGGRTAREVVTEFASTHPATSKSMPHRMGYFFRPDLRWVCVGARGYSLTEPGKVEWEDVYEYGPPADGWPTPAASSRRLYRDVSDPKGRAVHDYKVTAFRRSPAPFKDEDFTLTHFGYPEPDNLPPVAGEPPPLLPIDADALAPPRPRPWLPAGWLWAAAGLAVVGVLGYLVRRRRAARRAVP